MLYKLNADICGYPTFVEVDSEADGKFVDSVLEKFNADQRALDRLAEHDLNQLIASANEDR